MLRCPRASFSVLPGGSRPKLFHRRPDHHRAGPYDRGFHRTRSSTAVEVDEMKTEHGMLPSTLTTDNIATIHLAFGLDEWNGMDQHRNPAICREERTDYVVFDEGCSASAAVSAHSADQASSPAPILTEAMKPNRSHYAIALVISQYVITVGNVRCLRQFAALPLNWLAKDLATRHRPGYSVRTSTRNWFITQALIGMNPRRRGNSAAPRNPGHRARVIVAVCATGMNSAKASEMPK